MKIDRDTTPVADVLPWYLNGTLDDDDRRWVESRLAADPALREALAFDRQIAGTLEARLAELPAGVGWERLLERVRADAAPAPRAARAEPARPGWFARVGAWLTPQVGMALATLVLVQSVALTVLVRDAPEPARYRSADAGVPQPTIRALFADGLTEAAMRRALQARGATIVAGPNALGEYWLRAPDASAAATAEALQRDGVIASWVIDERAVRP